MGTKLHIEIRIPQNPRYKNFIYNFGIINMIDSFLFEIQKKSCGNTTPQGNKMFYFSF